MKIKTNRIDGENKRWSTIPLMNQEFLDQASTKRKFKCNSKTKVASVYELWSSHIILNSINFDKVCIEKSSWYLYQLHHQKIHLERSSYPWHPSACLYLRSMKEKYIRSLGRLCSVKRWKIIQINKIMLLLRYILAEGCTHIFFSSCQWQPMKYQYSWFLHNHLWPYPLT